MQAALLLITAVMIAGIHFLAADSMSERLVEWYIARTDYFSVQNQKAVAALQEYINSERLCSRDAEALDRWVKKQRLLDLTIYKNGILVFDSRYPDQAVWEEEPLDMLISNYVYEKQGAIHKKVIHYHSISHDIGVLITSCNR